jgi:hypothetical protein
MNKKYLFGIALVAIALGASIIFGIMRNIPGWQERSQFGDMFGAVDALFSGLAFIGLVYTIFLQQDEMKKQLDAVEKSNRLNGLATLVAIYSDDELKYATTNRQKSEAAQEKKQELLAKIESEFPLN